MLPLGALTVVTGGNGTGKSSLYRAVRLLALTARNGAASALAAEGGLEGLSLAFHQPGLLRPLTGAELSDGTLRYLLWVATLLTPRPPELLVLNEPETSLHPGLLPAVRPPGRVPGGWSAAPGARAAPPRSTLRAQPGPVGGEALLRGEGRGTLAGHQPDAALHRAVRAVREGGRPSGHRPRPAQGRC